MLERDRPSLLDHDRVSPRSVAIHSPNSSAFEIVAERATTLTDAGRWIRTSSQTAPR